MQIVTNFLIKLDILKFIHTTSHTKTLTRIQMNLRIVILMQVVWIQSRLLPLDADTWRGEPLRYQLGV